MKLKICLPDSECLVTYEISLWLKPENLVQKSGDYRGWGRTSYPNDIGEGAIIENGDYIFDISIILNVFYILSARMTLLSKQPNISIILT